MKAGFQRPEEAGDFRLERLARSCGAEPSQAEPDLPPAPANNIATSQVSQGLHRIYSGLKKPSSSPEFKRKSSFKRLGPVMQVLSPQMVLGIIKPGR